MNCQSQPHQISLLNLSSNIYYSDLIEPSDTSVTKILTWLIAHIGDLNTRLSARISIVGNDACPQLTYAQAAIFGILYTYSYYIKQMRDNLGAAQFSVLEVTEGDSSIRTVNRNEVAKTYKGLASDTLNNLNQLCAEYKRNNSLPVSINNPHLQPYWSYLYQKQIDNPCDYPNIGNYNCNSGCA